MKKTTGVLLVNLGTPDSPKVRDVRRYLTEFLNDPRVIDIPWLPRKLLVNGIIVPFRAPKSAKIYKELFDLSGGESPLLIHGYSLRDKLRERLKGEADVELAMRYGNPSIPDTLEAMRKMNYDKIVVFPLFPQYASASNGSAVEKAMDTIRKWWVIPEVEIMGQFWDNEGYINTIVERAKKYDLNDYDHIIFSYHGLPERQVDKVYEGDDLCQDQSCETEITHKNKHCYKATSYGTTRLIAEKLGLKEEDYTVAFQSRLNKKWLEPFSDEVVEERAKKGDKKLLMFSPAFVADCLETTIEIGDEYQEIFEEHGGENVQLVESLNDHPMWVDAVEGMVRGRLKEE